MLDELHRGNELCVLLECSSRGDRQAFGEFIDRTSAKARLLARAMGCDDVDETLQRCYRDAFYRLEQYAATGLNPLAWLLTLIHRDVSLHRSALL